MILLLAGKGSSNMISHMLGPVSKTAVPSEAVGTWENVPAVNLHPALIALLVAVAYYAGCEAGLFFTPPAAPISTLWPPNALLLAAFLLTPKRLWWILLLAVFPAHLLAQLEVGIPLVRSLGWFVSNTSEALLGAACIRSFAKEGHWFESIRGLTIFLVFGVVGAPLLTSFLDVSVVEMTGKSADFFTLWLSRLSTNMIANLTIVPTVVFFVRGGLSWFHKVTFEHWVEGSVLASGVIFVSLMAFLRVASTPNTVPGLIVLCPLPLLLWAAVRFGTGALSASMLIVALIASWTTVHGPGELTSSQEMERVLYMQIVLGLFALPSMILAAVLAERQTNAEVLKKARTNLVLAQEEERHRIAHELHDDLAQQLTLLSIELDHFKTELDPSARVKAQAFRDQLVSISEATRDLSHQVHPFALEYLGLAAALRGLCRRAGAQNKFKVVFSEENVPPRMDPGISLCLYRVAQAALQDLARHKEARAFTMELKIEKGRAWLQMVIDDETGLGCELRHSADVRLASAGEGLMGLNGTFRVVSEPQRTTMIEASVPLPPS